MGNGLARQVSTGWGHLPGNAFKVLTYMAWTALDVPNEQGRPARLYFGGIDPLVLALGRRDLPADKAKRKAVHRQVYTALERLEAEGAIERTVDRVGSRHRQSYRLTLTKRVSETDTQWVSETDTQLGEQNQRRRVSKTDTPRKEEEVRGGKDSRSEGNHPEQVQTAPGHVEQEIHQPCDLHPWERRRVEGECFACSTEQSTGQPVLEPAMHAYQA